MKRISSPVQIQKLADVFRRKSKTIGFVPTMGALHEGHLSLVRASRKRNDVTVVSIFVNPEQFGPKEDLSRYPRTLSNDLKLLKKEKVDVVFTPRPEDMYPDGFSAELKRNRHKGSALTSVLCGKYRPGHFDGVMLVVAKLFNIVKPHRAYFGSKDYQQAVVIKHMVKDMNFDVRIEMMPIIREKDGLAMSSRNRYLKPAERKKALALSRTLFHLKKEIGRPGRELIAEARENALRQLRREVDKVQYLEIVDPETLAKPAKGRGRVLAAAAVYVGKTRLIDNVIIRV